MSALAFHEKAGLCQHILWLSKFIFVFLCPDRGRFLAGEAAVKAERSEFILSLDSGLASHSKAFRAKENEYSPFPTCFLLLRGELKLSSPFHPHSL